MRSRILLNVFLLLLAAGLGLVVFLEPGPETGEHAVRLTTLEPQQVRRIRIDARGREPIELVKKSDSWKLTSPLQLAANGFRVDALVQAAAATSHARFPENDLDLAEFGLAPPKASLKLGNQELLFGDTDPLKRRRYVLTNGMVHLTTDSFFHQLKAPAPSFVHPAPLGENPPLTAITLFEAELRRSNDRWTVTTEAPATSADAVTGVVDAWRSARATSVRRLGSKGEPQGEVTVSLEGGAVIRFEVVQTAHEVILRRPDLGIQYHLPETAGARLLRLRSSERSAQENAG